MAKVKLKIKQGATFKKQFVWKDNAGNPVDLTGRTARMQLRPATDSSTIYHTLTTENGGITLGGVLGTIDLRIEAVDTAAFTWRSAVWDLEIVIPGGTDEVKNLVGGTATVELEVTRA